MNNLKQTPTPIFEKHFIAAVGSEAYLTEYCEHTELQRRSGLAACKRLLS